MKTEKISGEIAPQYGVREINDYVQENHNRELDEIILKFSKDEFEIQEARKYGHTFSRFLSEDGEAANVNAVASLLREPTGTYWTSSAGASEIGGTVLNLAGLSGAGNLLVGAGKMLTATAERFNNVRESKKTIFDYASRRCQTLQSAHTQQTQGADKSLEQNHNLVDRWTQSQQNLAEKITNNSV